MPYERSVVTSAVLAFVSTTVDDFAVMLMYFAKANKMAAAAAAAAQQQQQRQADKNGLGTGNVSRGGDISSTRGINYSMTTHNTSYDVVQQQGGDSDDSTHAYGYDDKRVLIVGNGRETLDRVEIEARLGPVDGSNKNGSIHNRAGYLKVMLGQTIGFTIVTLISFVGVAVGMFVPKDIITLVGVFPLLMGVKQLYETIKEGYCSKKEDDEEDGDEENARSGNTIGLERSSEHASNPLNACTDIGTLPPAADEEDDNNNNGDIEMRSFHDTNTSAVANTTTSGSSENVNGSEAESGEGVEGEEESSLATFAKRFLRPLLDPFVLEVTTMALICSSDNISIYIALFASISLEDVFIIVAVFYGLLLVNMLLAVAIMSCPRVADLIQEYSDYFVPFLLIGLGLDILSDSIIWP